MYSGTAKRKSIMNAMQIVEELQAVLSISIYPHRFEECV
jgi:hypothetical protein